MTNPYDDIINLPHHVSATRPKMSLSNRAAQFSPFAALTGYDVAIKEAARTTDKRIELGDSTIEDLDLKLRIIRDKIEDQPEVAVTYFGRDEKKEGGAYITTIGKVKRLDDYENVVVLINDKKILIENIINIECDLFSNF